MKHHTTGDNPELEALFERYDRAPGSYVFAPLADACRKAGMLEEAAEIAERGVARHPSYASGIVVQGKCYYDAGRIDDAENAFLRVTELDSSNLVALKFLGIILAGRGQAEAAMERFRSILALDPGNREIRRQLDLLGTERAGREPASSASGVDVEEGARGDVGGVPVEGGRQGSDEFEGESISVGEDDGGVTDELATRTLADIYAAQGYTEKAVRIYREVLRAQPGNENVRRRLEELEGPLGQPSSHTEPGPTEAIEKNDSAPPDPEPTITARSAAVPAGASTDVDGAGSPPDAPDEGDAGGGKADTKREIRPSRSYDQFKRWLEKMSD